MNELQLYCLQEQFDENKALNALQEHGVVSDLCEQILDVSDADARTAVEWMKVAAGECGKCTWTDKSK